MSPQSNAVPRGEALAVTQMVVDLAVQLVPNANAFVDARIEEVVDAGLRGAIGSGLGILAQHVAREVHTELFRLPEDAVVEVDLASQSLTLPGGRKVEFPVDSFAKHCLLEGIDELGYLLSHEEAIRAYEARRVGSINTLAPAAR